MQLVEVDPGQEAPVRAFTNDGRPIVAENLHKFCMMALGRASGAEAAMRPFLALRPGDIVLVDEADMAGTLRLDRLVAHADGAPGAQVRLLGDPPSSPRSRPAAGQRAGRVPQRQCDHHDVIQRADR